MRGGEAGGAPGVLISGASFAGLAAAWWMRRLGYAVTVVEQAGELRRGGTPVNIREGVVEVVRRMGLLPRIQAEALPGRPVVFLDEQGAPLPQQGGAGLGDGEEEYEVERDALLEMLYGAVEREVEWVFGDSIASLEQSAEAVEVTLRSGRRGRYALVLGCDGTHSNVRRLCFGEEAEFVLFLRNYFSLTIVPRLLMEENTSEMWSVPGRTVMLNTYNGKTDIAFCFASGEEISYDRRNAGEQKGMIRKYFEGRPWRVSELLHEMEHGENFYFDKLCQVRMGAWSKGRVVLVGDAGYCPSPAAGMGGSVAILGAAALGEALGKHPGDFALAFGEYERSFRPVVEGIQEGAVQFGLEMFMPGSEEALRRRNEVLGLG